ncbi:glycine cleavage system aminomethyltransferase GcvT [Erythrobacteraceae bacterium CFH 75059]|uniref:glycine cleavage system aminomethyltransferase GcvT n=1 Tax=Qipengyuania thermophila TaxID=2509361 RepID=UPI00101F990C|nr:glycine cleavage system aminomethyltransferase GcvT [Qipengyuania thermophila]TCD05488.1 glycine cleavage system aminomethyltransferase GcvT [Erythrobacteraceae bacterium CFH 75059]
MDDDLQPELLLLPLDGWHRRQGARMVPFAGYEMPIQYTGEGGGIVAEHHWTRTSAGLFDVSHMGQLVASGAGAGAALDALLPAHVSRLKPGRVRYSLLLAEDGGILDDLMVTNITEDDGEARYLLVVNGATKWDDIAYLREHLPDEVTLTHLDEQALLALQGPAADTVLRRLFPQLPENFVFMQSVAIRNEDTVLRVSRCGYTGEDGFELSVPADRAEALADLLVAQPEVRPAGLGARDSLRLEAGLPLYGHDMDASRDPVSADLGFALTKSRREQGGWTGHAACAAKIAGGVPERRVGLVLDGRLPAREGAVVYDGARPVGQVTSGGFSPTLGHPVAMAYVAADHAAAGTPVEVEVRGKRLPATVAPLPFVPHRYHRGH